MNNTPLHDLSPQELAEKIQKREVTSVNIVPFHHKVIS